MATLTTSTNTIAQYDTIVISGVNPSGYNGTWQVTAATGTTVSYALASNPGAYISGGTVTSPNIRLFNATNCYGTAPGSPAPPTNLIAVPK